MRTLLLILAASLLLLGLTGCACGGNPFSFGDWCDAGYNQHRGGEMCPVCGGTGYCQGVCAQYETVWRGCQYCGQW